VHAPILINCRDRLTSLLALIEWLEGVGLDEIYLLDNDSAYEPLLEYFESTPHSVIRLGANYGRLAPWKAPGVMDRVRDRHFVFTDPDIVPDEQCPPDAVDRFAELLGRYPSIVKVGFGLRIDDLPDHYRHKDDVVSWERPWWRKRVEDGVYFAPIDTTFALYRPNAEQDGPALRTGAPYLARHASWYLNLDDLPPDEAFYHARAANQTEHSPHTSHWIRDELPEGIRNMLAEARGRSATLLRRRAKDRLRWLVRDRPALRRGADDRGAARNAVKRGVARVPPQLVRRVPSTALRKRLQFILQASLERWPQPFTTTTSFGFTLTGTTGDIIQRFVHVYGVWEPDTTAWVRTFLRPGDAVLDVGANCGYFTLLFARSVGAGGTVIAVEPVPSIFAQLEENVRINGLQNVTAYQAAAGAEGGEIEIFRSDHANLGWSGTRRTPGSVSEGQVPRRRLDDLIPLELARRLRLIKIDAEGDEHRILVGLGSILQELPEDAAIIVEVTPAKLAERGHDSHALFGLLRTAGFAPYRFEDTDGAAPRLTPLSEPSTVQDDVVFRRA
jgi:FkbM family methyltransferase